MIEPLHIMPSIIWASEVSIIRHLRQREQCLSACDIYTGYFHKGRVVLRVAHRAETSIMKGRYG